MEDIIDKGSAIEAMLNSNYKDLYEEYLKAYTLANYADKIDKMNIKHDIKEVLSSDLYVNITAPNYQEQFEGLFNAYWDLKNTKESQTIGSAEYIQFQRICNTLDNSKNVIDNYIFSNEITDMKFNMYAVCLVGDYVSHNLDNDGKPFNATKITGIKIVQNSDKTGFDLVFDYNGYEYTKYNIPVDEIKDVLFSTEDRLSGFSTINTILIGDKNDVAKSDDKVIYEDETVRVKI
jgi:hypothetical protein